MKVFGGVQVMRAVAATAVLIGHALTMRPGMGVDTFAGQLWAHFRQE